MTKFGNVFKSLDSLRVQSVNTSNIAKSVDVTVEALPVKRAVYSHSATQNLAKSLRDSNSGGFWGAVRDRRYDEVVIESLAKSGAEPSQIESFLNSSHGNQLGVSLFSGLAKTLGISAHVRKTFSQWSAVSSEPVKKTVRESATERIEKYGTSDGARKAAETRRSYGQVGQTDAQIGAEERRYDGPKPTKEQNAEYDAQNEKAKQLAQEAYLKSGRTEEERQLVSAREMYNDLKSRFPGQPDRWGKNPDQVE